MAWNDRGYNAKMKLIADALGVQFWSASDCGCEDMLELVDDLKARGVHGAYVRHLATLLGLDPDHLTAEQIAVLLTCDLDVQYHAAALALGVQP